MDKATDDRTETGTVDERAIGVERRRDASCRSDGLEAIVVRYRTGRDRCTLVARDAPPEAMLTAWLCTDLETLIDLEDAR